MEGKQKWAYRRVGGVKGQSKMGAFQQEGSRLVGGGGGTRTTTFGAEGLDRAQPLGWDLSLEEVLMRDGEQAAFWKPRWRQQFGSGVRPEPEDAIPYLCNPGTPQGQEATGHRADGQRGHREVQEAALGRCWGTKLGAGTACQFQGAIGSHRRILGRAMW